MRIGEGHLENVLEIVRSGQMPKKYWVVACAVLASAISLGWHFWPPVTPARQFVGDMEPVEIYLRNAQGAGTRLRIPAAFMQWANDRRGGINDETVVMVVVYPGMAPVAKSGGVKGAEFSIHPLKFDSLVHIEGVAPGSVERMFADVLTPANHVVNAGIPGFQVYRVDRPGQLREYLVPEPRGDGTKGFATVLDCGPFIDRDLSKRVWWVCDAYVQPTDRLMIMYGLPQRGVDQIHEVETKMEPFMRGLIVDCFDGKNLSQDDKPREYYACSD